jgi:hypothetical protein
MGKKYVNAHATPPAENFSYFLSVMAWLAVFFIGFIFLLLILISVLPDDPEWVEYCAEYYPDLTLSACRTASGAN